MTTLPTLQNRILVIDDDDTARNFLVRTLTRQGYAVRSADGGRQGIALLNEDSFDVVVCDLLMPEVDGLDVLRYASSLQSAPPFLILTAHGSVGVAVDAMKIGAVDFLEKPIGTGELEAAITTACGRARRPLRVPILRGEAPRTGLIGSERWLTPFALLLQKIASTDAIVLVEGETGTGKSAVAREIWRLSRRNRGPFVEVNCAAIAKDLMENELFGHVKGAFTGAVGQAGKVEKASGGTLFLDEIGELPLDLQAKLLQLLQERTFTPVGSSTPRRADVRFVAATNRELEREARSGNFRPDLYFRLEVVKLTIPPLRERLEDIPLLLEHFRRSAAEQNGRAPIFHPPVVEALCRYDWPGNVRELENLVHRLSVMLEAGEEVTLCHLPDRIQRAVGAAQTETRAPRVEMTSELLEEPGPEMDDLQDQGLAHAVRSYESGIIRRALERTHDNVTRAARLLGMKRTTLIEKRRRYEDLGLL